MLREITAKYAGTCRTCGTFFEAGERILWGRGQGCHHVTCPEDKAEEAVEAEAFAKADAKVKEADENATWEDPGNRAEREMVEAEYRETYGDENLRQKGSGTGEAIAKLYGEPEIETHTLGAELRDIRNGVCHLCGSEGLCGCDEPERGKAYLSLVEMFETDGEEDYYLPGDAIEITEDIFVSVRGFFMKVSRSGYLRLAPKMEIMELAKRVS